MGRCPLSVVSPPVPLRDDVRALSSPVRCPFCHEGIAVDAEAWIACEGCLARHHSDCWEESGACGSCGSTSALRKVQSADQPGSTSALRKVQSAEQRKLWQAKLHSLLRDASLDSVPLEHVPDDDLPLYRRDIELERTLDVEVDRSRCGVWRSQNPSHLALSIIAEGDHTRVRVGVDTTRFTGWVSAMVGTIGGGLGGGLSYFAYLLGGFVGVGVWFALSMLAGFLLGRLAVAKAVKKNTERLDEFLDAVVQELS